MMDSNRRRAYKKFKEEIVSLVVVKHREIEEEPW